MSKSLDCEHCNNDIPPSADRCPHCGRPGLFPNVRAAENTDERAALERRYQSAKSASTARSANLALNDFEKAASNSKAVIARSVLDLQRLSASDNELYASYYQLIEGGIRFSEGQKWDVLRSVADTALFLNYKEQVRFAALSLDEVGLHNYGECSIILREDMIAHRASVFEENSILFLKHHKISMSKAYKLPKGYRASWERRAKLCIAKLHKRIDANTRPDEYSALLLRQGATSEEDEFIEVHIYGPMTARTMERVIISPLTKPNERGTILKAVKEKLKKFGVTIS